MEHHHNKTTQNKTPSIAQKLAQTKAISLQDNRPSSILQRKANNTAPIQRRVEEFRGNGKILYYSTYKRAVEPDDLELFHTREEAERIDEEYHQIWQKMQAANHGSGIEMGMSDAKASTSGGLGLMSRSHAASSKQEAVSSETIAKMPNKNDGKHAENPDVIHILQGLIKGSYTVKDNTADLHVNAKGDGAGLAPADMLAVAELLYDRMIATQKATGIRGRFMLHPTGAAIVKIMVNLLGEALGGRWSKMRARFAKATRKAITGPKSPDKLHLNILDEHFHYLQSLKGENAVAISPNINSKTGNHSLTMDDYVLGADGQYASRDMMSGTSEGNALFEKYKAHESDPEEDTSAGLDITIYADQLSAVMALLKSKK